MKDSTKPYLWNDMLRGPQLVRIAHTGLKRSGPGFVVFGQLGCSRGLWLPSTMVVDHDDASVTVSKSWANMLHGNPNSVRDNVRRIGS